MKNFKKIAGIMLALVMVLAMAVPAFAAEPTTGKITIDNATVGQTYTVYEILKLDSYNIANKAYLYKTTPAWDSFIKSDAINGKYVTVDETTGYVTAVDKADFAEFAKLAQEHAKTLTSNQGSTEATTTTVEFTGLELGYYLLDTTMGTICSLDTTNTDVVIKEKNAEPTNKKEVEEDKTTTYGTANDAEIGQTMNFKSTITAKKGAENYVFYDKMTNMTFGNVTGITLNNNTVAPENYTVTDKALTDGWEFEVTFTQAFCDTLVDNDKIVISYTAALNANAVIGATGNANESKLIYGQNKDLETTLSTTTSRTWEFNVFKYTTLEEVKTPLSGAEFTLGRNTDGTGEIKLVKVTDGSATNPQTADVYRLAIGDEAGAVTKIVTNASGRFTIKGLDSDTYYLKETKAPAGYNLPTNPVTTVEINGEGKLNATNDEAAQNNTIEILNQAGSELPSTGGIGTVIFYIVGATLIIGAGVLLVVRKRMSAENKNK